MNDDILTDVQPPPPPPQPPRRRGNTVIIILGCILTTAGAIGWFLITPEAIACQDAIVGTLAQTRCEEATLAHDFCGIAAGVGCLSLIVACFMWEWKP